MQAITRELRAHFRKRLNNNKVACILRGTTWLAGKNQDFNKTFFSFYRGDGKISVSLIGDVMRALGQNPTESEVKKLIHEHRADERVSFEVFLPILQVIIIEFLGRRAH